MSQALMDNRNSWEPKEPLELRGWNLLPTVNVRPGVAGAAHLTWLLGAVCSAAIHLSHELTYVVVYVVLWLNGHMCIQYILDRLRGRRASIGAASVDNEETPLQGRLLMDLAVCLLFVISLLATAVGIPGVEGALTALRGAR